MKVHKRTIAEKVPKVQTWHELDADKARQDLEALAKLRSNSESFQAAVSRWKAETHATLTNAGLEIDQPALMALMDIRHRYDLQVRYAIVLRWYILTLEDAIDRQDTLAAAEAAYHLGVTMNQLQAEFVLQDRDKDTAQTATNARKAKVAQRRQALTGLDKYPAGPVANLTPAGRKTLFEEAVDRGLYPDTDSGRKTFNADLKHLAVK